MGYSIDTAWKRMRKDDIEKLNDIIDDRRFVENEIARKLNMMESITNEFDCEISGINFDSICAFMDANGWKWSFYDDGPESRVPTKDEMVSFLRDNFLKRGMYDMIELGKENYGASSGGFSFRMGRAYDGTYYVDITFDIAHYWEESPDEWIG